MALKTKVKRENVVSEEDGNIEWITDSGKMMKAPAKDVEIIETEAAPVEAEAEQSDSSQEADTPPEPEAEQEAAPVVKPTKPKKEKAPPKAKQAAKAPAKPAKAAAPAKASPEPQPPQAAKPAKPEKEKTVASKAKKKSAAKGARTIGGKEVDLSKYSKVKAPGGGVSYNNGDATAKKLEGKSLDDVYRIVAKDTKQDEKELRSKYKHLNPGMQRMALGNMHRKGPRDAKKDKKAA